MGAKPHSSRELEASLRVLGLPEAASAAEIKRAYRYWAQRFHPDKNAGDAAARRHFDTICKAYRALMRHARLVAHNTPVGKCCICGEFREAVVGLDGQTRCPDCVLRPGGRLCLPMPSFVVVNCWAAIVLLITCLYLLIQAVHTQELVYALWATAAGVGVLVALAAACLRVVHCLQPHEAAIQRKREERERRQAAARRYNA